MEQVLFGGSPSELFDTLTRYDNLFSGFGWADPESKVYALVSTDGIIKNLRVKLTGAPGAGKKYTFVLLVNGAPTALTLDIADAATSGSNTVNEIDVTGGDYVSLRCTPDGTPTRVVAAWTSVFEGDTSAESLLMGVSHNPLNVSAIEYGKVVAAFHAWSGTENNSREVIPTPGTIKNFYVKLTEDPGDVGVDAYRFTLRIANAGNGYTLTDTSLTVTITANDTTGFDTANEVTVAAGDFITIKVEPLNSPATTPGTAWGMTFVADTDGESIVLGAGAALDDTATEYTFLPAGTTWTTPETSRYQLGQACTLKKLYILLSGTPGSGKDYTFTAMIAGTGSNVVATIADTATTGNSGALEDTVVDDNYVTLRVVPTGTPTVRDAYWGLVGYILPVSAPTVTTQAVTNIGID